MVLEMKKEEHNNHSEKEQYYPDKSQIEPQKSFAINEKNE